MNAASGAVGAIAGAPAAPSVNTRVRAACRACTAWRCDWTS